MAFAHCPPTLSIQTKTHPKTSILKPTSQSPSPFTLPLPLKPRKLSIFSRINRSGHKGKFFATPSAQAEPQANPSAADAFSNFKHLLLPITDENPYLTDGTRQSIATAAALATKYGADITVVVIGAKEKESLPQHETQISSIRWHLSEGGFQEYKLLERLGEGNKPTAIIGEVADDLNLDLVVLSMEAIHSKHIDANLLAEFIPCPVILLPL